MSRSHPTFKGMFSGVGAIDSEAAQIAQRILAASDLRKQKLAAVNKRKIPAKRVSLPVFSFSGKACIDE